MAIWLAVDMKYWITKITKIAAIAYPTLNRVFLSMIEIRPRVFTANRVRLNQAGPRRDFAAP